MAGSDLTLEQVQAERDRRARSRRIQAAAGGQGVSVEAIRVERERRRRAADPTSTRRPGYSEATGARQTLMHGATMGLSDEVAGFAGNVGGALTGLLRPGMVNTDEERQETGRGFREDRGGNPSWQDRFDAAARGWRYGGDEGAESARADVEQFRHERPNTALAAEVGAGLTGGSVISGAIRNAGVRGITNTLATGAGEGALYSFNTGENLEERLDPQRAGEAALWGAGTGGAVHAGGRVVGHAGGAINTVASRFGLNPEQRAVRIINRGLTDAGTNTQEVSRRAGTLRRQGGATMETVAEVGGVPLQRQARAVANVRGPGQQIAADTLEARTESITPRVLGEATRATTPKQTRSPRNYYDAREQLRTARSGQGLIAYRAAHASNVDQAVVQNDLLPLINRGPRAALTSAVAQLDSAALRAQSELTIARRAGDNAALQKATDDLQNIEDALSQLRTVAEGGIPNSMNARALDYYQRGLGQLAESAGYRSPEGSAMEQARTTFNTLLDGVAPALGQARTHYGASIRIEELMGEGRRAFDMPEGELDILLRGPQGKGLTTEEFDGFMLGVLDAIERKVRGGDTRFIARFMNNENWQRQLERALGKPGARRLRNRIAREASMRKFDNAVRAPSQTTPMAEDIKALTHGEDELGFISEVIQSGGSIKSPLLRRAAGVWERQNQPGIYNPRVNEALARRLYGRATPGNITNLEGEIAALPGYAKLGNLGQPTGRVAGQIGAIAGAQQPERNGPMRHVGGESFAEEAPIDTSRPMIDNPDGSFSTERTITIEADGAFYNIPTIVNGEMLTEEEAIRLWEEGQNPEVGAFSSEEEALRAARARSARTGQVRAPEREMAAP